MENRADEIIELLKTKNRCLERLMAETRTFLAAPLETLISISGGAPNALTAYENARATIIQTLELHDRTISEMITNLSPAERTPEMICEARAEAIENERLIVSVFNADDVVFKKIADAQNQIMKMIHENKKSHDILGRFKSAQAQTGEGMDKTL